jgi:hypothetical protein
MKAAAWMIIGSLGSATAALMMVGRQLGPEVLSGMLAPLAAACLSWVLIERTYLRDPERLTALMMSAFGGKMVFFGAYVAAMLKLVGLRPVPFVASFTGYFIGLYLIEALLMRRMFAGK